MEESMTEQELRRLSRKELLEMLIMQSEELESTKKKLANTKSKLLEREISIDNAGSIAEAALQVNGVFEAAQKACEQYIDNIKNLSKRQETICEQKMKECEQQTQKMLKDAQIVSIPRWRSHPIHENRASESICTEPCNPLLRATESMKRATSTY